MVSRRIRAICAVCAVLIAMVLLSEADGRPRKKRKKKSQSTPVIEFLRENGVDMDKKVVAVKVTGYEDSGTPHGPYRRFSPSARGGTLG